MDATAALSVLTTLADGLDPVTGEVFPEDSPYQHPRVIRALFHAIRVLEAGATRNPKRESLLAQAGKAWLEDEDERLLDEFNRGLNVGELARRHQRTRGAIAARLVRLGLVKSRDEVR